MANFLRDERLSSLTFDRDTIQQLAEAVADRGLTMPEYEPIVEGGNQESNIVLYFTIRFDQKGYRLDQLQQVFRHFEQAIEVERLVVELKSIESLRTNGNSGSFIDVRVDNKEPMNCNMVVTSDNEDWVNGSFNAIKEVLDRHRNKNAWVRTPWMDLVVQISGVFLLLVASLWGAAKIAPKLNIENAYVISFLIVLIVFGNIWGPIKDKITAYVNKTFPSIKFYRPAKDKLHWLYEGIVIAVVGGVVLSFVLLMSSYIGNALGGLIGSGQ